MISQTLPALILDHDGLPLVGHPVSAALGVARLDEKPLRAVAREGPFLIVTRFASSDFGGICNRQPVS